MMTEDEERTPLRMLFVCVGNSCRSQMAEGLARAMGGEMVVASSAGTMAADMVAPKAVQVMAELGIDISTHRPKALTKEMLDSADRVYIMGCDAQRYCPVVWLEDAEDWDLEDPMGQGLDRYREARDLIRAHMERTLRAEGIEPLPVG
jgi:arsenate reductase